MLQHVHLRARACKTDYANATPLDSKSAQAARTHKKGALAAQRLCGEELGAGVRLLGIDEGGRVHLRTAARRHRT